MFNKSKAAFTITNYAEYAALKRDMKRATPQPESPKMFETILIANRGDQPPTGGAAAKPNCVAAVSSMCDFTAEINYV